MRRKKFQAEEEEINMTPMLDVVFIMLIFFIVTASFVKEAGIDINRPPPGSDAPPDPDKSSILVTIEANDRIWIDQRMVDARAVQANIQRLLAEKPQSNVLVQAHRESTNQTLVKVMDAARMAGVADISVATATE